MSLPIILYRGLRDETRRNDDLNGVRDDDASQLSALLHKPVCDDVASAVRHYKPQRVLTHQVQNWHNEIKELKRALYKWQKSKTGTRPTHRLGFCGLVGEQVDSIEYHNNRVAKYGLAVDEMMTNPDMWVPTDTAFAVMTTMSSVAAATENKYLSAAGANLIAGIIREAPERRDLFWMNVSLNRVSRSSRWLLATVLAIALILLWYIPISFVQSFISMEYLSTKIPWFDSLVDAIPFMRGLLQGFLPLVCLKIFMAALPKICIGLAILEGCRTKSKIDRRSTSTLFYFQLFNVMLGSIAMSTVFTSLSMDVPISIFEMLGDSMPGTSTFFMNYVIVLTFIGTGVELLNMPMLFVSGFLVAFFVKTPVEEEKTIHPDPLEIAKPYAEFLLVMCIGLVFSTVAPIVLPSVVLYMFVCRYVFLNQLRYVYEPAYETGGRAWPLVFSRIMVCIMLFQATICGVLLSKDMVVASAMILPLLVLSIFFWRHLSNRYGHAYKHTPGSIAQRVDERARALALLEMSHAEYTEPEQPVKAVANTRRRSSAGSTDSDIDRPTTSQSTKDNTAVAINQTVRKVSKRDSPLSFYRSTPKSNLEMDSCGRLRLAANNPFARWRNHIPESMEATEVFMPDFDSKVRRKQKDCNWLHQLATATHPPSLHELFSELLKSNTEDSAGISIAECMVRDPREPEVKKFGTAAPDQCSLQSYKEGKTITLQGTIENLKQDKKKVNHPCE
ncbi:hypothetical protein SARC_05333 [Sphaeroforma arctica JP610]|uniref:CSC1/OSCA1-like 7TM region domain-containing protein n=1 Tax=Sphaeroforma arctica JP610 TaxID=667725 RepID=A0A0L0FZU2_9EUKA|nr:hypothetical protein SARC_05333 [Sphaeroforma arctica JP610]KNC82382.1 hypothetical protein SARC_05333 [Sphaeroforma arctica JP610]|eukprot:XP_014156284.1 hypothetical protein SARC_05333 [Sphaeroforma arctica JP610]